MTSLPKLAWSLVGTALFLGLIYFIFQDNRVLDLIFPSNVFGFEIKTGVENVRDKIYNVVTPVVAPVMNQGKKVIESVYDGIKDKIDNIIDSTKASAVDSFKNVINEKIDNVAEDIGFKNKKKTDAIPLNDAALVQDFPLGFTLKLNVPTVFVIKDTAEDNKPMSYTVDWGDSTKEVGEVPSSATRPLHHTWIEAGEYSVKISTNDGGVKKLFTTYMVVY